MSNGIKVVSEFFPSQVASVNVSIRTGSMYEKMENSGSAHFLEHLHFKGTNKRSKLDIEKGEFWFKECQAYNKIFYILAILYQIIIWNEQRSKFSAKIWNNIVYNLAITSTYNNVSSFV